MRIALTFPEALGAPGGGTVGVLAIGRHLREAGADVVLVHPSRGALVADAPDFSCAVGASRVHYFLDAVPVRNAVTRLSRARPFDVIVGWGTASSLLPPVARATGATFAVVAAKPSYGAWMDRRTSFRRIKRWSDRATTIDQIRGADVVFALSEHGRREIVTRLGVRAEAVTVAYWGVDESFASIARPDPPGVRTLFFAGTLAPHKGVHDAVRAMALVSAPTLRLRIAGWGDTQAVLDVAREVGVSDRVIVLGRLDRSQMLQELAAADCAVMPSYQESFGLAIAEAQAAGLPVVSYASGSIPEIVADGVTGWLVPPGDVHALSRAIAAAVDDPDEARRRGRAGRARIIGRFSWRRTAETMLDVFERSRRTVRV